MYLYAICVFLYKLYNFNTFNNVKFTKEQAFEILRSNLTNGGKKTLRMSEKSINAQLDTLIPLVANDEMELNDFIEKVKPTFATMNSNAEKDNSDFIKQWKEQHPETNPNPNTEPPRTTTESPEIKAMMDRIAALEKENNENRLKAEVAEKRTELVAKMKEKGITDTEWIDSFLGEVSIDKDIDVEAKSERFLKIYNKTKSSVNPSQTPHNPQTPPADQNPLKAASDFMKAQREAREKLAELNA